MKEVTSTPSPTYSPNKDCQSSDVEEYQVETSSTTSSKDYGDVYDCETDGTIALSEKPNLPSFGSVSVVNSNDVHFGNKTVYQGPVTIKQFVYPGSTSAAISEGVSVLEDCVKHVPVDVPPTANGVDNPAFVKDSYLRKDDVNQDQDEVTLSDENSHQTVTGIRKGLLWLGNLFRNRNAVIVILVLLTLIVFVVTVTYWEHPEYIINEPPRGDTDEQENTPVDYSTETNITINKKLRMVSRLQWLAQPPVQQPNPLKTPVALVIIQHTATEPCATIPQCIFQVKTIQTFHIESNHWWDIGYNFLIGGDGAAYEGRGWTQEGAHAYGYNNKSIGVGFIGTFTAQKPPIYQIVAFKKLIEKGIDLGYITRDYKIVAARQLSGTESPGIAFFNEIITWPHWSPTL